MVIEMAQSVYKCLTIEYSVRAIGLKHFELYIPMAWMTEQSLCAQINQEVNYFHHFLGMDKDI